MASNSLKGSVKKIKFNIAKKPDDFSFEEWQIGLRKQFSEQQKFKIKNIGDQKVFSDYDVLNPFSKKSYRVALRSKVRGLNFCACPDFKVNNLGTCKHIEGVFNYINNKKSVKGLLNSSVDRTYSSVSLKYGVNQAIILRIGTKNSNAIRKLASMYFDSKLILKKDSFLRFEKFLSEIKKIDIDFKCYDDAMDFIINEREKYSRERIIFKNFPDGIKSEGFRKLVNLKLYDYQKEAILKAAIAGRYLIADDMGLGKTIQSIAVVEILKKLFGIEKVIIICPTSLKYQWQSEIKKITNSESLVIEGMQQNREKQYALDEFYKIVSYNAISRDISIVNKMIPDLIILDEAQRIKNWKTKTAQSIKQLRSPYCLVLTGTPLENKLEELHSIVEFVDKFKLGLLSKFLFDHQIKDEGGKIVGYRELNKIGNSISSLCIRRTKKEVLKQLPERIDKTIMVDVTTKQFAIHQEHQESVSKLVNKWKRFGFLSEKDRQFLLISLNCMRMVSDSTYILDQKTRHDTKIDELRILLEEILQNKEEKVVIFSQWERMTRLIAKELDQMNIGFEYLHGGVPAKDRKDLLSNFRENPESKVFLSTDAGGVGLNLQSASVVINMDCPWNPAVLEQRIGRVHRLGQSKPVTVINYISKGTIEEKMLELIAFKKLMFDGVLDGGQDTIFMGESKMKQFMKTVEQLTDEKIVKITQEENAESGITETEQDSISEYSLFDSLDSTAKEKQSSGGISREATNTGINDLFQTGISFLDKLNEILSDKESTKQTLRNMIEKDEKTNHSYLKIPIANEEIITKSVDVLINLLQMIRR